MKKLIMASASALALMAAATSASAQSVPTQTLTQAGNGNVANVTQTGTAATLNAGSTLNQAGNNNRADITQIVNAVGAKLVSEVTQTGSGNRALVGQDAAAGLGADSKVTIKQYSAGSAGAAPLPPTASSASEGNFAAAIQAGGAGNQITINQGTATESKNGNVAGAAQFGGGNIATITQDAIDAVAGTLQFGSGNKSDITQTDSLDNPTDDPNAVVTQNGNVNESKIVQTTSGLADGNLDATVNQFGDSGFSRIGQTASGDNARSLSAKVEQKAGSTGARSEIDQTASGDDTNTLIATVTQSGSFGALQGSKITQDALSAGSTNLRAFVTQNGGAKSEITQTISASRSSGGTRGGDYVTANVTQDAGNTSAVTQKMDGPETARSINNFRAIVSQVGGTANEANITQEDTGTGFNDQLDALIDQSGDRNEARIEQTGAGSRRAAAGVPLSDATIIQSGNDNTGSIDQ
ncbi:MAG: hypothetical protein CFE32_15015, partial [Alphaproteobacteria bacterium PA3]